jgi:hypothetical protein
MCLQNVSSRGCHLSYEPETYLIGLLMVLN